jgi:hypothetical protein
MFIVYLVFTFADWGMSMGSISAASTTLTVLKARSSRMRRAPNIPE